MGSIRQTSSEVVLARFGRVWQGLAGSGKRELRNNGWIGGCKWLFLIGICISCSKKLQGARPRKVPRETPKRPPAGGVGGGRETVGGGQEAVEVKDISRGVKDFKLLAGIGLRQL